MAVSQARFCVLFRRGTQLMSRQTNALSPATAEGQRHLTTDPKYKKPYPYETSRFGFWNSLIDFTTSRFNENTRVVTVEGLPGVGKTDFTARLAEHFQLKPFPAVTDNDVLTVNGFDIRRLNEMTDNHKLKSYGFDMMYAESDPEKMQGIYRTQGYMFVHRYFQYVACLRHLLNTGQGVVLENNVYGDMVYASALNELGYFPRRAYRYYMEYRANVLNFLWKPHLIIYLDAPNDVILQRMHEKKPELKNSPVLNEKYLNTLREKYEAYLSSMSKYCEVLRYDVTDVTDLDLLFMDFENDDFMTVSFGEKFKYADWWKDKEEQFSTYRLSLMSDFAVNQCIKWRPPWDNPKLFFDGNDAEEFGDLWSRIPELRMDGGKKMNSKEPKYRPLDPVKGSYLDPNA